jgi:hypothetical protein
MQQIKNFLFYVLVSVLIGIGISVLVISFMCLLTGTEPNEWTMFAQAFTYFLIFIIGIIILNKIYSVDFFK